jgi:hypothetical protein
MTINRTSYVAMADGPFFLMPVVPHSLPKVIDGYDPVKKYATAYFTNQCGDNWKVFSELCSAALFCFGDINKWIDYHLNQVNLSELCYTLLEDTVRFIVTGRRLFPIASLEPSIRPANDVQITNELRKTRLDNISNLWQAGSKPLPEAYIGLWCSHEGGLRDLAMTVNILFSGRITR